jgi:hypothetical protein
MGMTSMNDEDNQEPEKQPKTPYERITADRRTDDKYGLPSSSVDPYMDVPRVQLYGQQIIRELSKADAIEELLYHHRLAWQELPVDMLRHMIVHARTQTYSRRMHREAGTFDHGAHWPLGEDD